MVRSIFWLSFSHLQQTPVLETCLLCPHVLMILTWKWKHKWSCVYMHVLTHCDQNVVHVGVWEREFLNLELQTPPWALLRLIVTFGHQALKLWNFKEICKKDLWLSWFLVFYLISYIFNLWCLLQSKMLSSMLCFAFSTFGSKKIAVIFTSIFM